MDKYISRMFKIRYVPRSNMVSRIMMEETKIPIFI